MRTAYDASGPQTVSALCRVGGRTYATPADLRP
jgi:hypothetical protein